MRRAFKLSSGVLAVALALGPVAAGAAAVDAARQAITVALAQEPPNLDSTLTTDLVSYFVIGHTNEGLLRYDRRGRIAPGVAESWDVTPERLTFHLRRDARWSNGEPVTAHDFVFAWRRVNDPATAAPFAAIMHPLRNAEAIQKGELPVTALGATATDDVTLVVDLERPCGYCESLMTHATFFPVNQAFFTAQGTAYGADAGRLLSNGPFRLDAWVHGTSLLMTRNPSYWNVGEIRLAEIRVGYITEDNRARLNLFRDGEIALVRLDAESVKDAVADGQRVRTFLSGGVAYLWFNQREGRAFTDIRLRQAVRGVFDAGTYVNKVIGIPGYRATNTLFPGWLNGVDGKFVDEYPPSPVTLDTGAAQALVAAAKRDRDPGTLTLLTVASPTGSKVAEYLQGLLATTLGLDVKVDQQTFKQYLEKSRRGDFDLGLASWYPDFDDIVTYADLLVSWNVNNRGRYANDAYDASFRTLQAATDRRTRMAAAAELQALIQRDVPVLPMAETGSAYIQHPRLRGVVRRVLGQDPDYTYAEVTD